MPFYYDYYSLVFLMPMIVLSFVIQAYLNSTYAKYSKISNSGFTTGKEIVMRILQNAGVTDVSVQCIPGKMSDHYDPTKKVISLSEAVYNGTSIAAIGIAAHETGHALQYHAGYAPVKFRSAIVGITNFSSKLLYFLIILSLVMSIPMLCNIAVLCFFVIFVFQLVTLPVEFNASSRAVTLIREMGYDDDTVRGVKKTLTAAALTYVAAMLISLAQMLSYIARTRNRN